MPSRHYEDGLPTPRRYYSAGVIWLVISIASLDGAIVNIALPQIGHAINASAAASIWIVNSYQLTIAMLLLLLAAVGDRIGHRRVYVVGLSVFTVGSLGCALSDSLTVFIAARIVQGAGAAGVMSLNASLVRSTYPSAMLGRGIGYNALVLSVSAAAGPSIAALILSVASWQWLFLVNVPIGIVAVLLGARMLPEAPGHGGQVDYASAFLSAVVMGTLICGSEAAAVGNWPFAGTALACGTAAAAMLTVREIGRPMPLIPFDLLRISVFSLSLATSAMSFAAQAVGLLSIPFLFQLVFNKSVLETGVLMTPWPLGVALTVAVAGRLSDRYPPPLIAAGGLPLFALGLWAMSNVGSGTTLLDMGWRMMLCGIGFGFFQAPNNHMIIGSAPAHRLGAAGGMQATARLTGQSLGAVAVAAAFHHSGLSAIFPLLRFAAAAAVMAALLSLMRMKPSYRPTRFDLSA